VKKVFIDCGFYKGKRTVLFKQSSMYSSDFVLYAFDPITKPYKVKRVDPDIIFHQKACWTYDGEIDFFASSRYKSKPSSIFVNPKGKSTLMRSPCIDFSKWILDNFQKNDYIVLKMDIEGAEYEVLPKMLKDGSMEYVNLAFVEFHDQRPSMDFTIIERQDEIRSGIKKIDGLELKSGIEWALKSK